MTGFLCHVSGRTDPTQFFYNMALVFDYTPDLHTLKRAVEEKITVEGLTCDGSDFIVSDIEILDFRVNQWVNLESRGQLYSGCFLTAIRDTISTSCAGAVDTLSSSPHLGIPQVLGFAAKSQRLFQVLDAESQGTLKLKGLLRVLRKDVHYAVGAFAFLDPDAEGSVTFQQFVALYTNPENRSFFVELEKRAERGGVLVHDPADSEIPLNKTDREPSLFSSSSQSPKELHPTISSSTFPASPPLRSPEPSILVGEFPRMHSDREQLEAEDDTVSVVAPGSKSSPSATASKLRKQKTSISVSPPASIRSKKM